MLDVAAIFSYFTAGLGFLIGYCTYKDYTTFEDSKYKKFHSIFSLYANGKSLINLKQPENAISCINGMKALSMPIIVFFHNFQLVIFETGLWSDIYYQNLKFRLLLTAAILPTDTFFVLSGFLSVKFFLQNENSIYKFLKNLYYRYMRFTPSAVFFMMVLISIKNFNGLHGIFRGENENCKAHWLSMLLYAQTYVNPDKMCIGPLWFATVSMQLFLVSPLILLLLKSRDKKIRLAAVGILLFATHIPGLINYFGWSVPNLYVDTLTRSYPYLFGMFYYCEFFSIKEVSHNIKHYLWIMTFLTFASVIVINSQVLTNHPGLIFVITRAFWPLALCWIVHACHMGWGGILNDFLSYEYFIPISSLSLGLYILNDHVGHYIIYNVLSVFQNSSFPVKVMALFSSTYVVALFFGALLYLYIEVPFYKLSKFNIRSQLCSIRNSNDCKFGESI